MTQKRSRDESARTTQPDQETEPGEHTEDEQVARRHPLHPINRDAKLFLQAREGNVHRRFDHDAEEAHDARCDDRQDQPEIESPIEGWRGLAAHLVTPAALFEPYAGARSPTRRRSA